MILSDKSIRDQIKNLVKCKVEPDQIQPASLDIRLGNTFSVIEDNNENVINMNTPTTYRTIKANDYLLMPGQFILATTMEYFRLPNNLTAFVEGRSSLGRMGLFIQNAGWVDPGFEGEITLELFNANKYAIRLEAGRRIGQLVFALMDRPAENPYTGKYNKQTGATGSKIYLDNKKQEDEKLCPYCKEKISRASLVHKNSFAEQTYGEIEYAEHCPFCRNQVGYFAYGTEQGLFENK